MKTMEVIELTEAKVDLFADTPSLTIELGDGEQIVAHLYAENGKRIPSAWALAKFIRKSLLKTSKNLGGYITEAQYNKAIELSDAALEEVTRINAEVNAKKEEKAETKEAIADAKKEAKAKIAFVKVQAAAKKEVRKLVKDSELNDSEKTAILDDALDKITNAGNSDDVDEILEQLKADLDLTKEEVVVQMPEEELAAEAEKYEVEGGLKEEPEVVATVDAREVDDAEKATDEETLSEEELAAEAEKYEVEGGLKGAPEEKEAKKSKKKINKKKVLVRGGIALGALLAVGLLITKVKSCTNKNGKYTLDDDALDKNNTTIETIVEADENENTITVGDQQYVVTPEVTNAEKEAFVEDATDTELDYQEVIDNAAQMQKDVDAFLEANDAVQNYDAEDVMAVYTALNMENISDDAKAQLVNENILPADDMEFLNKFLNGSDVIGHGYTNAMSNNGKVLDITKYIIDPDNKAQANRFMELVSEVRNMGDDSTKAEKVFTELQNYYLSINDTALGNANVTAVGTGDFYNQVISKAIIQSMANRGLIDQLSASWFEGEHQDPATGEVIDNTSINQISDFLFTYSKYLECAQESKANVR